MNDTTTRLLARVRAMVERGDRISEADAVQLLGVRDTIALARIARIPRERRWGRSAHYPEDPIVELRPSEVDDVRAAIASTESRSVILRVDERATAAELTALREEFARSGVTAVPHVSAAHLAAMARERGSSVDDFLDGLNAMGATVVTGEGAEIFDPELRAQLAPGAIAPGEWFDVHRSAHRRGMQSIAAMTYLTEERPEAYVAHLSALRALQDETAGFTHFIPLPVHNRSESASFRAVPTAGQSLRMIAVSRIVLDNIPHVAVAARMVGTEVALIALAHGADTVDLTMGSRSVQSQEKPDPSMPISLPVLDRAEFPAEVQRFVGIRRDIEEARYQPVAVDALLMESAVADGR